MYSFIGGTRGRGADGLNAGFIPQRPAFGTHRKKYGSCKSVRCAGGVGEWGEDGRHVGLLAETDHLLLSIVCSVSADRAAYTSVYITPHGRYRHSWNSVDARKGPALENIPPRGHSEDVHIYRAVLAPILVCRAIELGKPPQQGCVIHTLVCGTVVGMLR